MRYGEFLVWRYAPTIGRPQTKRRVTVLHRAFTLDGALHVALTTRQHHPDEHVWIERLEQRAHRMHRSAKAAAS